MGKEFEHARQSERFKLEAPIGFMVALNPTLFKMDYQSLQLELAWMEQKG
jgi:hypothetical protein